jgi:hypothetical protein
MTTSKPLVATVHSVPPPTALAVPLSLVGVIILLAGSLALHHHWQLTTKKQCACKKLAHIDNDGDVAAMVVGLALDLGHATHLDLEVDVER